MRNHALGAIRQLGRQAAHDTPVHRRRRRQRRILLLGCGLAVVLVVVVTAVVVTASGRSEDQGPPAQRYFSPTSFWNLALPDGAATVPAGRAVARVAAQARYSQTSRPVAGYYGAGGYNPIITESSYSVPVYTVGPEQPRVPVTWIDDRTRRPASTDLACGLQRDLGAVPLPVRDDGRPLQADGTDGHLVVVSPSTDEMWEFWQFADRGQGRTPRYVASYGARITRSSTSSGVLPCHQGARATSLALVGGVITMEDWRSGHIDHALAVSLPVVSDAAVPPATRTDGPASVTPSGDRRDAVPEGTRLRLPPGYACDSGPMSRPRLLRMICTAARDHGLVVVDRTGGTVTMYAEDDRTVGTPYQSTTTSPWPKLDQQLAGRDDVLQRFPWSALQQLQPAA